MYDLFHGGVARHWLHQHAVRTRNQIAGTSASQVFVDLASCNWLEGLVTSHLTPVPVPKFALAGAKTLARPPPSHGTLGLTRRLLTKDGIRTRYPVTL